MRSCFNLAISAGVACALGSFQYVFPIAVTNSATEPLRQFLNSSLIQHYDLFLEPNHLNILYGVYASLHWLGGAMGGFLMPVISNSLGRKKSLVILAVSGTICLVPGVFAKYVDAFEILVLVKFLNGILAASGMQLQAAYITEISPVHLRGRISSFVALANGLSFTTGSILSLKWLLGTTDLWPWLFVCQVVISLLSLIIIVIFCEETPQYLLSKCVNSTLDEQTKIRVEGVIRYYHGEDCNVSCVIQTITEELTTKHEQSVSLFGASNRLYLSHAIMMGCILSFSGIDVLSALSSVVLSALGLTYTQSAIFVVLFGVLQLFACMFPLWALDRLGRRPVFLSSALMVIVMNVFHVIFTVLLHQTGFKVFGYCLMVSMLLHLIGNSGGFGSMSLIHMSELCPTELRASVMSVSTTVTVFTVFLLISSFLLLQGLFGDFVFLVFAFLTSCICVYYYIFIPEANNKLIGEIVIELERRWKRNESV